MEKSLPDHVSTITLQTKLVASLVGWGNEEINAPEWPGWCTVRILRCSHPYYYFVSLRGAIRVGRSLERSFPMYGVRARLLREFTKNELQKGGSRK